MKFKQHKGFTLIEVMIAVVVFSFGLLGVAGIMTVAVKNNHNGYMRSQATILTATIIDMMRRNKAGVKAGLYDGTFAGYADISTMCTSVCGPAAITARDVQQWSNMLTQLLPNSVGSIACDLNLTPGWGNAPTDGFCTATITWSESNEISADSTQSISLVATP
ncbi:MAG: type IV pilus modification protein PilV [Alcanivoracaceae bacterium]|nr:type IV pilus modification protein PilV [Alcanivoracaceae bacterium]